jgi:hypothetical protein
MYKLEMCFISGAHAYHTGHSSVGTRPVGAVSDSDLEDSFPFWRHDNRLASVHGFLIVIVIVISNNVVGASPVTLRSVHHHVGGAHASFAFYQDLASYP